MKYEICGQLHINTSQCLGQNTTEQSIPVGGHLLVVTHLLLTVSMTFPGGQVHARTHRAVQIWLGSESQVLGHGDAQ